MDEQAAMTGDWLLYVRSPSPEAYIPSFLAEEQFSLGPLRQMISEDTNAKQGDFSFDNDINLSPLRIPNSLSRGGLAARIAARAGFNPPRLDTESIRSNDRSFINEVKSWYLTNPSGISPSTLLESPVFISNLQTQSPTTGKFQLFTDGNEDVFQTHTNGNNKENIRENDSSSFAFKPHEESALPFSLCAAYKMSQDKNPQALSNTEGSVRSENRHSDLEPAQVHSQESLSKSLTESGDQVTRSEPRSIDTVSGTADYSPSLGDQPYDEGYQTTAVDSMAGGRAGFAAEDGYHWRKYGQKQIKGSEFPRSYYRCTHSNCPVKKKVEMTPKGIITKIIYGGAHNHPEPPPHCTSSMGASILENNHDPIVPENVVGRGSVSGTVHNRLPLSTQNQTNCSFDPNSMTLMNSEIRHPLSSVQMQNSTLVESGEVTGSSTYSNDEGISITIAAEGDESESKRRKVESFATELGSGATKANHEPRVVVQTRSDVDLIDDGYRWRKYGQKVVKGNHNPRSYYKCTQIGCAVRKHVERASNDHKSVITTYEGKHNHDVPVARSSRLTNPSTPAAFAPQQQNPIPTQPPQLPPFNIRIMQPPVPPPPRGFPTGIMNQSTLSGFNHSQNKFVGLPVSHPYPQHHGQLHMNDMSFMMPGGEPNSLPNLNISNGSSGYHQGENRLSPGL